MSYFNFVQYSSFLPLPAAASGQGGLDKETGMAARLPMLFIEEAARNKNVSRQLPASSKFATQA